MYHSRASYPPFGHLAHTVVAISSDDKEHKKSVTLTASPTKGYTNLSMYVLFGVKYWLDQARDNKGTQKVQKEKI